MQERIAQAANDYIVAGVGCLDAWECFGLSDADRESLAELASELGCDREELEAETMRQIRESARQARKD